MKFEEFVKEVQQRGRFTSKIDAIRSIRATLQTLSERLAGGEAKDLASQLPQEIGSYLYWNLGLPPERMALEDFFQRVALRESADMSQAIYHARVVMEVLQEAVSPGEIKDVRGQLPPEYAPLFESGSTGQLKAA